MDEKAEKFRKKVAEKLHANEKDIKVVFSPLRICPLGAHVDHQNGLVCGMPINEALLFGFIERNDSHVHVQSGNFKGKVEFDLHDIDSAENGDWGNYIRGAAKALQKKYKIDRGVDGYIEGNLPIGGLSSSAAVGVAYLLALEYANDLHPRKKTNIELDRFIENRYLGLKNGILDPSIILMGKKNALTYLDCESIEFREYHPKHNMHDYEILIVYSGVKESLKGTDYNNRVEECETAAKLLLEKAGGKTGKGLKLRNVPTKVWQRYGGELPEPLNRRAKHFFTECERVSKGVQLWEEGDIKEFGKLMQQSGASSVNDYESGCPELTMLYELLNATEGVYGARFSGGGFRGSCIGLVDPSYKEQITHQILEEYPKKYPNMKDSFSVHYCEIGDGAHIV